MKSLRFFVAMTITFAFVLPATVSVQAEASSVFTGSLQSYPYPSISTFNPTPLPPGKARQPGQDMRVTNSPFDQNEVSIAVNPMNPSNIIIGANDFRGAGGSGGTWWCGVYTTFNGGVNWAMGLLPKTGGLSSATFSADPSVAFDLQGNAYYTCLGYEPISGPPYIKNNSIAVAKSVNGGLTFGTPVSIVYAASSPPFHDKPYMAIDKSMASPYRGSIYVSWTNFTSFSGGASPIYFSRSVDGGASFSTPMKISGMQQNCQGSQPGVGPNGEVYVSFVSYVGNLIKLYVARSLNGGLTFEEPVYATDIVNPGDSLPPGNYRTPTIPSIAVDSSNGPYSGSVYVVFQDGTNGHSDVCAVFSRNRGLSWSLPIRINDDRTPNHQFFPFVSTAPNGRVDVVFYDRRNDPGDFLLDVYAGVSHDGGVTYRNRRITDTQIDPGFSNFIGDYIGVTSTDASFYPTWCGFVGTDEEVFMEVAPVFWFVTVQI